MFGDRLQAIVFAGLSLGALVVVGILRFTNRQHFQRFLGSIDPLIAFPAIIVLGFVLLGFLHARGWFVVYTRGNSRGLLLAAGLAALLGVIMILVDTKIVYPEDTNVPSHIAALLSLHGLPGRDPASCSSGSGPAGHSQSGAPECAL